jgi:hypothetical protein
MPLQQTSSAGLGLLANDEVQMADQVDAPELQA